MVLNPAEHAVGLTLYLEPRYSGQEAEVEQRIILGRRQGDWKCIWRSMIPTSVDLYNLTEDPYEKNNVAAAHPDKIAAMQERLNALGASITRVDDRRH